MPAGRALWFFAAAGALALGIGAWWRFSDSSAVPAGAAERRVAMRGEAVYRDYCASCHGVDLEGQPDWRTRKPDGRLPAPPHDASGHTWHHSDEQLFALTKHGVAPFAPPGYESDMPAFAGTLSDDDIRAVLAYIKSRWPADIRARQPAPGR